MNLSILLPICNEKENVTQLIEEIVSVIEPLKRSYEIIAVDDGSRDGTGKILLSLRKRFPNLKVIQFRMNSGQTAALDAGFKNAKGEYIVTMDADLQNDPHDIPKMIEVLETGYDCVAGFRHKRKDKLLLRKFPSKVANYIIRKIWKSKLHDLGCSLKVFRREVMEELKLYGEMHRFLGLLMEGLGAKVIEVKVNHRSRMAGESKYNLSRTFKVLLDLVTIWFMRGYRTKPIYVFGGAGAVLTLFSVLSAVTVLYDKYYWEVKVHNNPLFVISIFFGVLGVQFIVLGLLAELIIRTYFESTHQTPYTICNKVGFKKSDTPKQLKIAA